MIRVLNIRRLEGYPSRIQLEPWQVYIGRENSYVHMDGCALGNPYDEKTYGRDECLRRYRWWLGEALSRKNRAVRDEMNRLWRLWREHGKLDLICWCAPKACHGDTIKSRLLQKAVELRAGDLHS